LTAALAEEAGPHADMVGVGAQEASPVPDATHWLAALGLVEYLPELPPDVPDLLALLPKADLYVQDEVQTALHPTLTRLWSRKGQPGQRRIAAPGQNQKFHGFGLLDWREGWLCFGFSPKRDADTLCRQLDACVERSQARGRSAIVLLDNAKTHTAKGAKQVRATLERHGTALRLVYTPPYDPQANPTERLWKVWRRHVTHNHQRADFWDLYADAEAEVARLQADPAAVLRHVGSPGRASTTTLVKAA
jgi:hypothetical protein